MAEKWDKKTIAEYAEQLRSPFDEANPDGQKPGALSAIDRIKQIIGRKKETQ